MSQQLSMTSLSISWNILSPGRKWDILLDGTIFCPKNASWTMVSYIYARDMANNRLRYIQDMPEIHASFAQGMGIQIDKEGRNVAGEGA